MDDSKSSWLVKLWRTRLGKAKLVVILMVTSISLLFAGYIHIERTWKWHTKYSAQEQKTLTPEYLLGKYHAQIYERNLKEMEGRIRQRKLSAHSRKTQPLQPTTGQGDQQSTDDNKDVNRAGFLIKEAVTVGKTQIVLDPVKHVNRSNFEYPEGLQNDSIGENILHTAASLPTEVASLLDNFRINENVPVKVDKPTVSSLEIVNHYWQQVMADAEVYLYSAYYDDRDTLDKPMIRIIAVAEVNPGLLFCLHWYDGQKNPDLALIQIDPIGPKISPTGEVKYEQYLFSCALVPDKGPPEKVSVISTGQLTPTTLLTVQIPDRPQKPIQFGHCMSVIYWQHDPYRIVEWLEIHRIFGVQEVTVYNNSLDNVTSHIFQSYARQGFVDFRQAPSIRNDNSELTILLNMSPVINDCMYRNMYRYRWVVCTDLDEMIVPRRQRSYAGLLRAVDLSEGRQRPAKSYMFSNVYFFTDLGPVEREPWFLMTSRYLRHVTPSRYGYSVKSITDPMACVGLQNHVCWKRVERFRNDTADWNVPVNRSLAMNYHYKRCHLDEFEGTFGQCKDLMTSYRKDFAMKRFERELYDRVVKKLLDLGLIEEEIQVDKTEISYGKV